MVSPRPQSSASPDRLGDRDGDVLREIVSTSIELFFEARDVEDRTPG